MRALYLKDKNRLNQTILIVFYSFTHQNQNAFKAPNCFTVTETIIKVFN